MALNGYGNEFNSPLRLHDPIGRVEFTFDDSPALWIKYFAPNHQAGHPFGFIQIPFKIVPANFLQHCPQDVFITGADNVDEG